MGLFKKKEKKQIFEGVPSLPELPEIPRIGEEMGYDKRIPQLPTFPNNSTGEKFSQSSIKEAVRGGKEEGGFKVDEFEPEMGMRKIPPPKKRRTKEAPYPEEKIKPSRLSSERFVRKEEPIFVRIDKFEEGMKTFEKVRNQISAIEEMLRETKKVKEEEERELQTWEKEIQLIKSQIEKIDKDIFSKI